MHKMRVVSALALVLMIFGLLLSACSGRTEVARTDAGLPVVTVYKSPT